MLRGLRSGLLRLGLDSGLLPRGLNSGYLGLRKKRFDVLLLFATRGLRELALDGDIPRHLRETLFLLDVGGVRIGLLMRVEHQRTTVHPALCRRGELVPGLVHDSEVWMYRESVLYTQECEHHCSTRW